MLLEERGAQERESQMSGLACTLQKPPACVQAARPGYFSGVLAGPVGAVNAEPLVELLCGLCPVSGSIAGLEEWF